MCVLAWHANPLKHFSATVLSYVVRNNIARQSFHLNLLSAVFLHPYDLGHFHYAVSAWNSNWSQQRHSMDGFSLLIFRFLNQVFSYFHLLCLNSLNLPLLNKALVPARLVYLLSFGQPEVPTCVVLLATILPSRTSWLFGFLRSQLRHRGHNPQT